MLLSSTKAIIDSRLQVNTHTHTQWHRTATTASNCLTGDLNNGLQAKCTCANATVSSEREAKDRTLVSLSLPSHTLFYNMLYYNMFIAEPLKWHSSYKKKKKEEAYLKMTRYFSLITMSELQVNISPSTYSLKMFGLNQDKLLICLGSSWARTPQYCWKAP